MIVSRLLPLVRRSALVKTGPNSKRLISTSPILKDGAWAYRSFPPSQKNYEIAADCAGVFFWWWVFWHLMTDYHHIIGHNTFPDIDAWTDEELGIPPDDEDDPE